jgi:hypothetical protein
MRNVMIRRAEADLRCSSTNVVSIETGRGSPYESAIFLTVSLT